MKDDLKSENRELKKQIKKVRFEKNQLKRSIKQLEVEIHEMYVDLNATINENDKLRKQYEKFVIKC